MSGYSDLYRAFSHLGFPGHAWQGNLLKGRGRWYLTDGHTLFRTAACNDGRGEKHGLYRPHEVKQPEFYAREAAARRVIKEALETATVKVGPQPDAWGKSCVIPVCAKWELDEGPIAFDAHRIRYITYVTRADRLLVAPPKVGQQPSASVFYRGSEWAALLMPLRDWGIEWEEK